jgi:hemerythrin-like metal-binding protein
MEAFVWDQRFVTGIAVVDDQHHRLVDITNRLGDLMLAGGEMSEGKMQLLFMELSGYAREHFSDEESLMREAGLDPRHIAVHTKHHHEFVEQLAAMWRTRGAIRNPAETVHGFLSAWLAFHILGEDQAMARQIAFVQAGDSPAAAYKAQLYVEDSATATLLNALGTLYHLLSEQNRNLAEANARLEQEIKQRKPSSD